jgi:hypothetical protein
MSAERPGPPQSVPTLTEVISWPDAARPPLDDAHASADGRARADTDPRDPEARGHPMEQHAREPGSTSASLDEDALARRVLDDLQRQLDGVLEYRVREVLTPILERAADALVRDARRELSRSLAELVDRAVAEQLRRQRAG